MVGYKRTIRDVDIKEKTVFLRVAYDLPLDYDKKRDDPSKVIDDSRIRDTIPTITSILDKKPSKFMIAAGWQSRPKGEEADKSMAAAAMRLKQLLSDEGYDVVVKLSPNSLDGSEPRSIYRNQDEVRKDVDDLKGGEILLFENVRYDKEANKGDPGFAEFMASLAGEHAVYVNDAEAQNHRPECTIAQVPQLIVKAGGDAVFGLKYADVMKKIGGLGESLRDPDRGPFTFYLSGKKIEVQPGITSKISVTHTLLDKMKKGDVIVVQGAVIYTFLLAQHYAPKVKEEYASIKKTIDLWNKRLAMETADLEADAAALKQDEIQKEKSKSIISLIGSSEDEITALIGGSYRKKGQEGEQIFFAYDVLAKAEEKGVKMLIPFDHVIANEKPNKKGMLPDEAEIKVFDKPTGIPEGWLGVAPGPETMTQIKDCYIDDNGISLQAGPVQIEDPRVEKVSQANKLLGEYMREALTRGWTTIAAGGDTASFIKQYHIQDAYSVISNAGGATLELIQSGTSKGIEAIKEALEQKG